MTNEKMIDLDINLTARAQLGFLLNDGVLAEVPVSRAPSEVQLTVDAPYAVITTLAEPYLNQKPIEIKKPLIYIRLSLYQLTLSGNAQGDLQGSVLFKGTQEGKISFSGKPVLNKQEQLITVQDAAYTIETDSVLITVGKWLLKGLIETELKKLTTVPLSTIRTLVIPQLTEMINRPVSNAISIRGNVHDIDLQDIQVHEQGVSVSLWAALFIGVH